MSPLVLLLGSEGGKVLNAEIAFEGFVCIPMSIQAVIAGFSLGN